MSFQWTSGKEEAALLVAFDELSDEAISAKVGISRRTLNDWKNAEPFQKRVESHLAAYRAKVRKRGIAIVENRIAHLQRRHDLMNQVIADRSQSPEMADVPGGKTGLMVHNVKSVGAGENAERVDLYEVDAALLKELREHERQAAQELGQWTEKREHSGNVTFNPITLDGDKVATDG